MAEPSTVLVDRISELLDTLTSKLLADEVLAWLRTAAEVLNGRTPIEAIVGHRIRAVLAAADQVPDASETAPQ